MSGPVYFAEWLRDQLVRRNYDLRPKGGGQTKFANESGIGRATISRILAGRGATEVSVLSSLAKALDVPLPEVLIIAGVIDADELAAVRNPHRGTGQITPQQAADELGIEDPQSRALFISMTQTLQRTPNPHDGEGRAAEH